MRSYRTHVFDLDGVLLDSNKAKSKAFYETAFPYGEEEARRMVAFHQSAGSMSRRERWEHFFSEILGTQAREGELDEVITRCRELVRTYTRDAALVPGVREHLRSIEGNRVVVTGVLTGEAIEILAEHDLSAFFARVYGGPRRKQEVLRRLVGAGTIDLPAVYYGDTQDDYESATAAGLDFVFVAGCSEFEGWQEYFADKDILAIEDFTTEGLGTWKQTAADALKLASVLGMSPQTVRVPSGEGRVRVDREGFAVIRGERVFLGATLAGAEVTVG